MRVSGVPHAIVLLRCGQHTLLADENLHKRPTPVSEIYHAVLLRTGTQLHWYSSNESSTLIQYDVLQ